MLSTIPWKYSFDNGETWKSFASFHNKNITQSFIRNAMNEIVENYDEPNIISVELESNLWGIDTSKKTITKTLIDSKSEKDKSGDNEDKSGDNEDKSEDPIGMIEIDKELLIQHLNTIKYEIDPLYAEAIQKTNPNEHQPDLTVDNEYKDITVIIQSRITGRKFEIKTNTRATVFDLKMEIRNRDGIPPDQLKLKFNNVILRDRTLLCQYQIKDNSYIDMILILRGGMMHETSGRIYDRTGMMSQPTMNKESFIPVVCIKNNRYQKEESVKPFIVAVDLPDSNKTINVTDVKLFLKNKYYEIFDNDYSILLSNLFHVLKNDQEVELHDNDLPLVLFTF